MDITDFAAIGAKIAELTVRLKAKRDQIASIQEQISAVEQELLPLVTEHSRLLAELVGASGVKLAPIGANGVGHAPTAEPDISGLKVRIKQFLQGKEGISAADVAEALHIDPTIVRQAMRELYSS